MNKKQSSEIKNSIHMYEIKIKNLKPLLTDKKPMLNAAYNRLLTEKAVLKNLLTQKESSIISKFIKKVTTSKKELICDYFK